MKNNAKEKTLIQDARLLQNGYRLIAFEECMDESYGATVVQFEKDGVVSFAFSSISIEDVKAQPELVVAELVQNESYEKLPLWSDLSEPMVSLITDSLFDMKFVEFDDDSWTEEMAEKIWDESVARGLDNVVRIGENNCLITVYAGAIGSIDWTGHPQFGLPYLEKVCSEPVKDLKDKDSLEHLVSMASQHVETKRQETSQVVYSLCEEHEGDDGIREFHILGVATDMQILREMMESKIKEDEYGLIAENGVDEHGENSFCSKFNCGFVNYYIIANTLLQARDREKGIEPEIE